VVFRVLNQHSDCAILEVLGEVVDLDTVNQKGDGIYPETLLISHIVIMEIQKVQHKKVSQWICDER